MEVTEAARQGRRALPAAARRFKVSGLKFEVPSGLRSRTKDDDEQEDERPPSATRGGVADRDLACAELSRISVTILRFQ